MILVWAQLNELQVCCCTILPCFYAALMVQCCITCRNVMRGNPVLQTQISFGLAPSTLPQNDRSKVGSLPIVLKSGRPPEQLCFQDRKLHRRSPVVSLLCEAQLEHFLRGTLVIDESSAKELMTLGVVDKRNIGIATKGLPTLEAKMPRIATRLSRTTGKLSNFD